MKSLHQALFTVVFASLGATALAQNWPVYGGDSANTRYSQAAQVNTANGKNLRVA